MLYQILALLIWSSSLIVGKLTYSMMDPVLVVQVRLIIAMIIVMPLFLRRWKKIDKPMRKQLWWLAFFNYTAVFLLQFIGLKYTSASSAVTMIGLEPLLVVFVGHFFFKDKAKWFHWLFGAMAFIGVAILINGGKNNEGIDNFRCRATLDTASCGQSLNASLYLRQHCTWHHHNVAIYGITHRKLANIIKFYWYCWFIISCHWL